MNETTRTRLLLLLLLLGLVGAVGAAWFGQSRVAVNTPWVKPDPAALLDPDVVGFCRAVQADLAAGRYAALDAAATSFQSLKDRFKGGREKLVMFYSSLQAADCTDRRYCVEEAPFPARIAALDAWRDHDPGAAPPLLALASTWMSYAWAGRHCHGFTDVTYDEWQSFYDRIWTARDSLDAVTTRDDPEYLLLRMAMLRDSGGTRAEIAEVYNHGHAIAPQFLSLVSLYARLLEPGWYGSQGDLAQLADSVLRDPGGDDGAMEYATVTLAEAQQVAFPRLFQQTGLSWDRTKAGLAIIDKRYGLMNFDWNLICFMAYSAGDGAGARDAYRHFGQNWDYMVWGTPDNFYGNALPWILNAR